MNETLNIDGLVSLTGCSRATLYRLIRDRQFPQPVKMRRRSVWRTKTVLAWIEKKDREQLDTDERMQRLAVV